MTKRGRGIMSEELKYELAKGLGVYESVKAQGWGSVPSRDCGNLVTKAIEKAQSNMASNVK